MFFKPTAIVLVVAGAATPALADDTLTTVGDVLQIALPAAALYTSYELNGADGLRACGGAVLTTAVSTHALKALIDEPRPNGDGHGMPSGHTSSAAVGFGCILGQEGFTTRAAFYAGAAALVGWSRIENDKHTPEQVVAGYALGTLLGYWQTKHLDPQSGVYSAGFGRQGGFSLQFTQPLGGFSEDYAPVSVQDSARQDLIDFAHELHSSGIDF